MKVLEFSKLCCLTCIPLLLISCGMLSSGEREVRRNHKAYFSALNNGDFKKAIKLCHKDFAWTKGEQTRRKGAANAFHVSVRDIHGRTSVMFNLDNIIKITGSKYIVAGTFIVRNDDNTRLQSVQWPCNIVWVKTNEGWRILEIKETGPRSNKSS